VPDPVDLVTSSAIFFSTIILGSEPFGDRMAIRAAINVWKDNNLFKLVLRHDLQEFTERSLQFIYHESTTPSFGYQQSIILTIQLLLIQYSRALFELKDQGKHKKGLAGPQWLERALHYIEAHLTEPIYLGDLAKLANMSQPHFSKMFKQMIGLTLTDYIATKRILLAKERLEQTNETIQFIAEFSGFSSIPHFHRTFLKYAGMTPATYRNKKQL